MVQSVQRQYRAYTGFVTTPQFVNDLGRSAMGKLNHRALPDLYWRQGND